MSEIKRIPSVHYVYCIATVAVVDNKPTQIKIDQQQRTCYTLYTHVAINKGTQWHWCNVDAWSTFVRSHFLLLCLCVRFFFPLFLLFFMISVFHVYICFWYIQTCICISWSVFVYSNIGCYDTIKYPLDISCTAIFLLSSSILYLSIFSTSSNFKLNQMLCTETHEIPQSITMHEVSTICMKNKTNHFCLSCTSNHFVYTRVREFVCIY